MKLILLLTALTYIISIVSSTEERFLESVLVEESIPNGPLYTRTIEYGPEFSIQRDELQEGNKRSFFI